MKNLLLFSLAALVLIGSSCNRTELDNGSFDFERTGRIHNATLDHLTSKIDVSQVSKEEIYSVIVNYSTSQIEVGKSDFNKELREFKHKDYSQDCCEIESWLNDSKSYLSDVEYEYINKMVSVLKKMKTDKQIDFAQEMLKLQKNIVIDKRGFRKEMLVNAFSIAKYSFRYWKQAQQTVDHPYYFIFSAKSYPFPFTTCQMRDIIAYIDAIDAGATQEAATNEAAYQSAICNMP
jgi:hypothetical protein